MIGQFLVPCIASLAILGFSVSSQAQTSSTHDDVAELSDQRIKNSFEVADFSFHGRVKAIEYRQSVPDAVGRIQPFTFVTFEVVEPLSEGLDGKGELVLKFFGGALGPKYISVSHAPIFNVGDEDILFVKGNGRRAVPVSQANRFRIFEKDVYTDQGFLLGTDSSDRNIRRLAIQNSTYFSERRIGPNAVLRRVLSGEEKKGFPFLDSTQEGHRVKDDLIQKLLKQNVKLLKRDTLKGLIRNWSKERKINQSTAAPAFTVSMPAEQSLEPFRMSPVKAVSAEGL